MTNAAPPILLTGRHGQVGWELLRELAPLGAVTAVDVEDVDLADPAATRALVRAVRPRLIVNPAAYTAVDQAEREPELAHRVNAEAPRWLSEEAGRLGAWMIHYSTDYVFDGNHSVPYRESDPVAPLSAYGRSKAAGEAAIQETGASHVILRMEWAYAARGKNFLRTMLRLARERGEVRVVDDQRGAPTWSRMVAVATAQLAARILAGAPPEPGIYHLPSGGETTWCGFARAIFARAVPRLLPEAPRVTPIATAEFPTPARRPAYSVLDGAKARERLGIALPPWERQLDWAFADALESQSV